MARETINGISVPIPGTGEPADFVGDLRQIATDLSASIGATVRDASLVASEVWLIAGQSNAQGYATTGLDATFLDAPDSRVLQFMGSGPQVGQVGLATEPLYHRTRKTGSNGFGLTFGKLRARQLPGTRKVLLVPCAEASTGFGVSGGYTWDKDDATAGTFNLAKYALGQLRAALATHPDNTLGGVLWHQGENDTGQTEAWYEGKLDTFIAWLRTELGAPDMPFIVGQMTPDHIESTGGGYVGINQAHIDTPSRVQHTAFAPGARGLVNPNEDIHYNAAGLRAMGVEMFEALARAQANATGGGAPPTLPAPGVQLILNSLYVAIEEPEARVTDYLVRYRAVGDVSWTTYAHTAAPNPRPAIGVGVKGTNFEVQIAAVNEDGTSAWSPTATTTDIVPLRTALDRPMLYGLSVVKVHASYSGPCLRLRRSSDNTEQDIGFNARGELDEDAALAFVGAGDGYVVTWYDQSGNARDFTQATTTKQPQMITGGVMRRMGTNGRPTMKFFGDDQLTNSTYAGLYNARGCAVLSVIRPQFDAAFATSGRLLCESRAGGNTFFDFGWSQNQEPRSDVTAGAGNDAGAFPLNAPVSAVMTETAQVFSYTDTKARVQMFRDGLAMFDTQAYTNAGTFTLTRTDIGAEVVNGTASKFYIGDVSQLVAYGVDLAPWERAAGEANESAMFRVP